MLVLAFPQAATPPGMLLATSLEVLDHGEIDSPPDAWDRPRAFWMRLATDRGPVTLIGAHLAVPIHPSSLPCPYCPTLRDAQVRALADFMATRAASGETLILAGDLNLAPGEVAYRDLAFLTDVSRQRTWRPFGLSWLPPLLRLDYVLITPDVAIVDRRVTCSSSGSDHCPLVVDLIP
jgi:endonuclease/exonuclease/phosphatase family metal-dependent hydrolase